MRMQWKSMVMIAALALGVGIAGPAWSGLADPMMEDYSVHVIPFYKIDAGWASILVVTDTSYRDLSHKGSDIHLNFYDAACNFKQDASLEPTKNDAQIFILSDINDANGQFNGIPGEGVILLDGDGNRFLTYILLINPTSNSLVRIDSIPCKGSDSSVCYRDAAATPAKPNTSGTWLRYDSVNTVAATLGDSGPNFRTNLYFFSAPDKSDLNAELLKYGTPRHGKWAGNIHLDGYCNETYLGSRRLVQKCTQRVSLTSFNFTNLNTFPDADCDGRPGHLVTFASDNGTDPSDKDYSGFQETIVMLAPSLPDASLIATGYMHHSDNYYPQD